MPPETAALRLLEQNMATHKFAVGQALHFSPGLSGDRKGPADEGLNPGYPPEATIELWLIFKE